MLSTIIKSQCDKRIYRHLKLTNGMRCILIADDEADKSAASLDVKVGCALDPKPLYGTAHFLEHMLFMGTAKYPSENEYSQFIQNNGGMNNAYTSLTNTNYHFDCSNDAFEEGLDRFAQFFIAPSFSESGAEREVKAVDSEFNQSLQSDGWHFFNLCQHLSAEDSLMNRFNCGNSETLSQPGIRESLLKFHEEWYSSNIMKLTVSGRHDIDELEKWVVEKFSPIEDKQVELPDLGKPEPFSADRLGKLVRFVPVKDKDILTVLWILPYVQEDFRAQPLGYYSFLFGHEGENSLLSYLKSEGLANELGAGGDHELWSYSNFYIDIFLTKKGLANYEQVLEAVFTYSQKLNKAGPQEYIYTENNDLGKMQFEFQDKKQAVNYCISLASKMQVMKEQDTDQILRSNFIIDEFDHDKLRGISNELCDISKVNVMLRSKSFEEEGSLYQTEPWYGTKYHISDFSDELKAKMSQPSVTEGKSKLDLPNSNSLIPKNFDILPKAPEVSQKPLLLKSNDSYDLWYLKDDKFERPKAYVSLKIYTGDCLLGKDPKARTFVNLWAEIQNDYMREFNYMANCASLSFEVSPLYDVVNFRWHGFNHSMPTFINQTLERIVQMHEDVQTEALRGIFDQIKEKQLGDLKNFYYEQSYQQAFAAFEHVMVNTAVEHKQMHENLEQYTYEDFQAELKQWLKTGRQCWYVCGNYDSEQAESLVSESQKHLDLKPISIEDLPEVRALAIEDGHSFIVERDLVDKENQNSCTITYYEVGTAENDNLRLGLTNSIMMQFLSEPFFNQLRTQQQLGYVVFSRAVNTREVLGAQFMVQSPKRSCEYIVNSINDFLIQMRQEVNALSDEDFEVQKQAVLTKLAEKDLSLSAENSRHFGEISTHHYLFDRQQRQISELQSISKDEFIALFEQTFFSPTAKRIDLQLNSDTHKDEQALYRQKNQEHAIFKDIMKRVPVTDSLVEFKKQSGMHADVYKANYAEFLLGDRKFP